MSRDLKKYTYDYFLKTGKIIDEYYDNKTKVTICNNFIQEYNKKEKNIFIDEKTKKIQVKFYD